jgi:hypothetical protein
MADSHAVFGTAPNCCRHMCLQSTFPKDDHAEAQSTPRHSPTPPRALRLCVIKDCRCHVRRAQRAIRCIAEVSARPADQCRAGRRDYRRIATGCSLLT